MGGKLIGPTGRTASRIIANSDRNGDGKLSRAEYRGNPRAFPKIDGNSDGFRTKQEFETRWRQLGR